MMVVGLAVTFGATLTVSTTGTETAGAPLKGVIVTVPLYVPGAMPGPTTAVFNETARVPGEAPVVGTLSQFPPLAVVAAAVKFVLMAEVRFSTTGFGTRPLF